MQGEGKRKASGVPDGRLRDVTWPKFSDGNEGIHIFFSLGVRQLGPCFRIIPNCSSRVCKVYEYTKYLISSVVQRDLFYTLSSHLNPLNSLCICSSRLTSKSSSFIRGVTCCSETMCTATSMRFIGCDAALICLVSCAGKGLFCRFPGALKLHRPL